ncbi:DUF2515 family protein [Bacillus sp. SJS]|uniref:DUF2515 family protein n=1 Tax=Bacillus sp. SJS TaxID=1423321 RepID=UPI0006895613|nr:DUF2515 family protein [Bacillus sp. SJS]KZZ84272.1 hypothetical protein AS29_011980 [Bacillus sp. SJS]
MKRSETALNRFRILEEEKESLYTALQKKVHAKQQPFVTAGDERDVIQRIKSETAICNVSNLTRTQSYLMFHSQYPEVHWALLAHLVSRNGGYSMTDLKSSYIGPLLHQSEKNDLFQILEIINAAIFLDAYPQLLLYEESKKRNRNLFHLLPAFRVSAFMEPIWSCFFQTGNSALLTRALITNEQSMIEENILSGKSASIFSNLKFSFQEKWGLTNILFPYKKHHKQKQHSLAGITVTGFQSLSERIRTGKKLYHILFHHRKIHESILAYCKSSAHTGSRSDYWPHLFSSSRDPFRLTSPYLADAWPIIPGPESIEKDWLLQLGIPEGFELPETEKLQDLTNKVMADLLKLAPISAISKKLFR